MTATDAPGDGSAATHALQRQLATRLHLRDGFAVPLRTVGGLAVSTGTDGSVTAAIVVVDAVTGARQQRRRHRIAGARDADLPLSFRALPAVQAAAAALPAAPDLLLVAGHGIDHPRGLGSAAHFGLSLDLPTLGVARRILHGRGQVPHDTRGAYTALRAPDGRQLGWLLRADPARAPVVVAPGHRVAMASAADLVMRFTRQGRIPGVLRLATRALTSSGSKD
jgi:deoxyribonuclease V